MQANNETDMLSLLQQEMRRHTRQNDTLAIIKIDIDFYKSFVENQGEQSAESMLQQVFDCLQHRIQRSGDVLFHTAGDEFTVILPHTDHHGALQLAKQLCKLINELEISHANSKFGIVTASFGVTDLQPDQYSAAEFMIEQALAALSLAKRAGRNCCHIAVGIR